MNPNKNLQKANKIVSKATTVFGEAITKVEKANIILLEGIENDSYQALSIKNKIMELQYQFEDLHEEKKKKGIQLKANDDLIEQLRTFAPIQ